MLNMGSPGWVAHCVFWMLQELNGFMVQAKSQPLWEFAEAR